MRGVDASSTKAVELRRRGFRFIALADDNFYPVSLADLAQARRRLDPIAPARTGSDPRRAIRADVAARAAARRHGVLHADHDGSGRRSGVPRRDGAGPHPRRAGRRRIGDGRRAEGRLQRLQPLRRRAGRTPARFKEHGIHVLGSFIFGLPSDRPQTFDATAALAERADVTFAQFVMLTPFPGTVDFEKWERDPARQGEHRRRADDAALADSAGEPPEGLYAASGDGPRRDPPTHADACGTGSTRCRRVWARARVVKSWRSRLAFVLISKLYRQMYANTGIATDSARTARSVRIARMIAPRCRGFFTAPPMPDLEVPMAEQRDRAMPIARLG